jgi:multidrug resistance protein MdtO
LTNNKNRQWILNHSILVMPVDSGSAKNKELAALPSKRVALLIPGAISDRNNIAFALKISLCATICYILYHAIDWPGTSTSVTTVMVTGLSTTGAMKRRLTFRLLGAIIGGLIFGLGATAFLFLHMDSITSFVILVGPVAFLSSWIAGGPRFNNVGLQIAFAFYLVALGGFRAPTQLAPARDRFVGILFFLIIMWFVFDRISPVRTVTAMRRVLASVLRGGPVSSNWLTAQSSTISSSGQWMACVTASERIFPLCAPSAKPLNINSESIAGSTFVPAN